MESFEDIPEQMTNEDTPETKRPRTKRGEGEESQKVKKRIANFDVENCRAIKLLKEAYGKGIVHQEVKSLAHVICDVSNLKLDRDEKRDSKLLIKWFDDNIEVIEPLIKNLSLLDENNQAITPMAYDI